MVKDLRVGARLTRPHFGHLPAATCEDGLPLPTGDQVVQTDIVACRLGFPRRPSHLPNDDSSDDNRDDSGPVNYVPYSPKMRVSCLVTAPACSWQCGGQGFESP
jgi:hypothetical protein